MVDEADMPFPRAGRFAPPANDIPGLGLPRSQAVTDVVFAKVNTDEEQEIAQHFQIRSIPTLMVFREQIIVFSQPGALPQGAFEQVVQKAKTLDMDEVRKHMAEEEKKTGTA